MMNAPDVAPTVAAVAKAEPDAHGQAALLLAEGILHELVAMRVLTLENALSVIETTCEVKIEVAEEAGESNQRMQESLRLLQAIFTSFSADRR